MDKNMKIDELKRAADLSQYTKEIRINRSGGESKGPTSETIQGWEDNLSYPDFDFATYGEQGFYTTSRGPMIFEHLAKYLSENDFEYNVSGSKWKMNFDVTSTQEESDKPQEARITC